MTVIREGQQITINELSELRPQDVIECDNYEHLVALCKNLAYAHIEYRQKDPLVVTIYDRY